MEPFAALSAFVNIVEILKMGTAVLKEAHSIYQSTSGMSSEVEEMQQIYNKLAQLIHQDLQNGGYLDNETKQAAVKCKELCEELQRRLSKLQLKVTSTGMSKVVRTGVIALRSVSGYREEIEKLKKEIKDYQVQMTGSLIVSLSKGLDKGISSLQQQSASETKELGSQLKKLKSDLRQVDRAVHQIKSGNTQSAAILEQVHSMIKQLATASQQHRSITEAHAVLISLGYQEYGHRYAAIQDAHEDTFGWIYGDSLEEGASSRHLLDWLEEQDGYFWVTGKPGAGKSTLMKFLVDSPQTAGALGKWAGSTTLITARHFFWSVGSALQHSYDGLLRSLLLQVFAEAPTLVRAICEEELWWTDGEIGALESRTLSLVWTVPMMEGCLHRLAKTVALPIDVKFCFFIDGLDECDAGQKGYYEMSEWLKTLTTKPSRVKICFASQRLPAFQRCFGNDPCQLLQVHECTASDVIRYARSKLTEHNTWRSNDSQGPSIEGLVRTIRWRAEGVFLWVAIVVRNLCTGFLNGDSMSDLTSMLDEIPSDLEAYIRMILVRTKDRYQQRRMAFFRMALSARGNMARSLKASIYAFHDRSYDLQNPPRRMSPEEYKGFIAGMDIRIQAISGGLFYMSNEDVYLGSDAGRVTTSMVTFLHRTVMEFVSKHLETLTPPNMHTFDPNLAILGAQVLSVQLTPLGMRVPRVTQGALFCLLKHDWENLGLHIQSADRQNQAQTKMLLDTWERVLLQDLPGYRVGPDENYTLARKLLFILVMSAEDDPERWRDSSLDFTGTDRQSILSNLFQICVLHYGPTNYIRSKMEEDITYLARLPDPPLQRIALWHPRSSRRPLSRLQFGLDEIITRA